VEDVYQELSGELGLPIIYDIDCGHLPPQITLVNGAFAEVEVEVVAATGEAGVEGIGVKGRGTVKQYFRA
jgi:muramoyltetrapeptide carboxypeptidase